MAKLIGTAGHVDHGKTTLIKALTGIDADRLPEEKKRGMTIDVGFAYIDLPTHGRVSIVDVPGHEKFLRNMLVGALGIDVGLLCVAADAGVKPQTVEHLQILELLPVDRIVVAVTRTDLVEAGMRTLCREEIVRLLEKTRFAGSPVIEVSSTTREGLDDLRQALDRALTDSDDRSDAPWYLPIDRSFSAKGYGCVVTGTLAQGRISVGDIGLVVPGDFEVRIRGIQCHGSPVEVAEFGQRTALNLSGVRAEQIARGQAIGRPGALFESDRIDATLRWIQEPKHGLRIRVSIGAEEAIGKVLLNDGRADLAQLKLETPVACALGQPLIVRRYSPPELLGGGRVLVPKAVARRKSEAPRAKPESAEPILGVLRDEAQGVGTEEICRRLGKTPQALGDTFERLSARGAILGFAGLWFDAEAWAEASEQFLAALGQLHESNPLAAFVPREKVVAQAGYKWTGKPLDRIVAHLAASGKIQMSGPSVKLSDFKIRLTERQRAFLDRALHELKKEPVNTPTAYDLSKALVAPIQAIEEILRLGVQAGEIASLGDGVWYTPSQLARIRDETKTVFGGRSFTAGEFRDHFKTSRKYAIPLLESFDAARFTVRMGDKRVVENG